MNYKEGIQRKDWTKWTINSIQGMSYGAFFFNGQHVSEKELKELMADENVNFDYDDFVDYLNKNFNDVILLVNCNNAMELGWIKNYPNIKSVINFPGPGRTGTWGLGYMMTGLDSKGNEISPSGHLVDTFVYDNFSSPAMQNMGDFRYEKSDYYYVAYNEGIYIGYKYYETRYEDSVMNRENVGTYDYSTTVTYPFGYGLSYTDFSWSNYVVNSVDENGNINVSVNVKNNGTRAGRDVVQIYAQSPYTQYDIENKIEKSSVQLVGFAKTKLLKPQEEETIKVSISLKDMTSYDS
jgi:beta-glucosidase